MVPNPHLSPIHSMADFGTTTLAGGRLPSRGHRGRTLAIMHARALILLGCLLFAGCAGTSPIPVWAALNCSSIGDPKNGGTTYQECVEQWIRTNDGGPASHG